MIDRLDRLSPREKVFLAIGVLFVATVILVFGVYQPYQNVRDRAETRIAAKQRQVDELLVLQADYRGLQRQMQRVEAKLARPGKLSALAVLEGIAAQIDARENLDAIRPQPPRVEGDLRIETLDVSFERLSLTQVVHLLRDIERAEAQLQVTSLQLKQRFDDNTLLDATLSVASFRRAP